MVCYYDAGQGDLLKENDLLSKTAELDDLLNELLQESDGMDYPTLTPQLASMMLTQQHIQQQTQQLTQQSTQCNEIIDVEKRVERAVTDSFDGPRPPPRGASVAVMDG